MRKIYLFLCLLISCSAFAQRSVINLPQQPNPWRVGGGLGLNFGSDDYFGIHVSPFIGYQLNRSVELGLTAGYQYAKWTHVKQHLFNTGPYLNFYPVPQFFARAHYEYYTGQATIDAYPSGSYKTHFDESALWLGAGYRSVGRVQFYAGLMYNVLYDSDDSIFANGLRPIVGVSFAL